MRALTPLALFALAAPVAAPLTDGCDEPQSPAGPSAPEVALWTVTGDSGRHWLGRAAAGGGDLTGDGIPDLVLGEQVADADGVDNRGAAFVFSGALRGDRGKGDAAATVLGSELLSELGVSMAVGDVTGDGRADLVVGQFQPISTSERFGQLLVFAGPLAGTLGREDAWAVISLSDQLGYAVPWLADLDDDGQLDLVVTGSEGDRALIYPGPLPAGELIPGDARTRIQGPGRSSFGEAVAAGDFDGDGDTDLAVSAPDGDSAEGQVFLFDALPPGSLSAADASGILNTGEDARELGVSLAAGDLDGDGIDDLILSVDDQAEHYRVDQATRGIVLVDEVASSIVPGGALWPLGTALAVSGDIDGDGLPDLLLGGTDGLNAANGGAWILPISHGGAVDLSRQGVLILPGGELLGLGYRVCPLGDVDGDGLGDFALTAPGTNRGELEKVGGAVVISGGMAW